MSAGRKSQLILLVGGAASGKSEVALALAGKARRRAFVATGQARDGEMKQRISRHQAIRPSDWETAEVPKDLEGWMRCTSNKYQIVVIDCLTLWLNNLGTRVHEALVSKRVDGLLRVIREGSVRVVIVSNELGMGLVPIGRSARRFRDLAGKVNQRVAAEADEVYFVISGQVLRLK